MIIKERPIITWLLNPNDTKAANNITIAPVSIPINRDILDSQLGQLNNLRASGFDWGLPELVMPSFEAVMVKSHSSFEKIMPSLFEEFSVSGECGILLYRGCHTLVYCFVDNELHLWSFTELAGKSVFNFYSFNNRSKEYQGTGILNTLLEDNCLFKGSLEQREMAVASVAYFIATYVAVKKYVKVETVVIPQGKFTAVDGTPLEYVDKKKVINQLGQKVIVMDSRWFRKIVNDNEIFVRGFWRMQNKKNEQGALYKELIFVDPFIRHGYHRDAKIENGPDE